MRKGTKKDTTMTTNGAPSLARPGISGASLRDDDVRRREAILCLQRIVGAGEEGTSPREVFAEVFPDLPTSALWKAQHMTYLLAHNDLIERVGTGRRLRVRATEEGKRVARLKSAEEWIVVLWGRASAPPEGTRKRADYDVQRDLLAEKRKSAKKGTRKRTTSRKNAETTSRKRSPKRKR